MCSEGQASFVKFPTWVTIFHLLLFQSIVFTTGNYGTSRTQRLAHQRNAYSENDLPRTNTEPPSIISAVIARAQANFEREVNCKLNKIVLKQVEYFQYIEYNTNFPPLTQFHFCTWIKSINLTTEHTIFSYAVRHNPDMIAMWISPTQNQTGFHLVINGVKVYNLNYEIPEDQWLHICQSWNSVNGQWGVFVNGQSVGDGYGPQKLIGFTIPGGGKGITGQEQDNFQSGGFDHAQGIQGEITLFEMHDVALGVGSKGSVVLGPLQTDCLPRISGNVVSWGKTHLKLYGGAEIYAVKPRCRSFLE